MQVTIKVANNNNVLVASPTSIPTLQTTAITDSSRYSNTTLMLANVSTAYTNAVSDAAVGAAALYQTTAGLSANVLNLTSNAAGFLGNSSGTIANIASWISGNSATAYANATANAKYYASTAVANEVPLEWIVSENQTALGGANLTTDARKCLQFAIDLCAPTKTIIKTGNYSLVINSTIPQSEWTRIDTATGSTVSAGPASDSMRKNIRWRSGMRLKATEKTNFYFPFQSAGVYGKICAEDPYTCVPSNELGLATSTRPSDIIVEGGRWVAAGDESNFSGTMQSGTFTGNNSGAFFSGWIDKLQLKNIIIDGYGGVGYYSGSTLLGDGGLAFSLIGDDMEIDGVQAWRPAAPLGNGFFRLLGGNRVRLRNCRGVSGDGAYQIAPAVTGPFGNRSFNDIWMTDSHVNCYAAPLVIALFVTRPDLGQAAGSLTCSATNFHFERISGNVGSYGIAIGNYDSTGIIQYGTFKDIDIDASWNKKTVININTSNAFSVGEVVVQPSTANSIGNATAYGTVLFSSNKLLYLSDVIGTFTTNGGNIKGLTSGNIATPNAIDSDTGFITSVDLYGEYGGTSDIFLENIRVNNPYKNALRSRGLVSKVKIQNFESTKSIDTSADWSSLVLQTVSDHEIIGGYGYSNTDVVAIGTTSTSLIINDLTISNTGASATPTFSFNETVTQATTGATGVVSSSNSSHIIIKAVTGIFSPNYLVSGSVNSNTANVVSISTINDGVTKRIKIDGYDARGISNGSYAFSLTNADSPYINNIFPQKSNTSTTNSIGVFVATSTNNAVIAGDFRNVDTSIDNRGIGTKFSTLNIYSSTNAPADTSTSSQALNSTPLAWSNGVALIRVSAGSSTSVLNITGAPIVAQTLTLTAIGTAFTITAATAGNGGNIWGLSGDFLISPNQSVIITYNVTNARWQVAGIGTIQNISSGMDQYTQADPASNTLDWNPGVREIRVSGNGTINSINATSLAANNAQELTIRKVSTGTLTLSTGGNISGLAANYTLGQNESASFVFDAPNKVWVLTSTSISLSNSTTFLGTANNSAYLGGTIASGYQTTAGLSANVAVLTANNANNLGGVAAASYVNTSGAYTITGIHTHNANVFVNTASLLVGNATINTSITGATILINGVNVNTAITGNAATAYANAVANAAALYQTSAGLSANIAAYLPTYAGVVNGSSLTVGTNFVANSTYILVGNTTAGANAFVANATQLSVGNSTVNTSFSTTSITTQNTAFDIFAGANRQFRINYVASVVNYLQVSPAATGGAPAIAAAGSDSNVSITITPKGTGNTTISNNSLIVGNSTVNTAISAGSVSVNGSVLAVKPTINLYTSSGTWTKKTTSTVVDILVVGGGGGGGYGGYYNPAAVGGSGGAGGGGAGFNYGSYRASDLPSSITFTVGAGGVGGNSTSTTGGQGTVSVVGTNLLYAAGGGGGAGGLLATSSGGGAGGSPTATSGGSGDNTQGGAVVAYGSSGGFTTVTASPIFGCGQGGGGSAGTTGAASPGGSNPTGATGGGAGGGFTVANVAAVGNRSGTGTNNGRSGFSAGSSTPGVAGTDGAISTYVSFGSNYGSIGGGGGAASNTSSGGNGGAGGLYGGGGGGGGAAHSANASAIGGTGGAGANGIIVFVEW